MILNRRYINRLSDLQSKGFRVTYTDRGVYIESPTTHTVQLAVSANRMILIQ